MSPVERIEAAITKLEQLKAESSPGAWYGHQNILGIARVQTDDRIVVAEVYGAGDIEAEVDANVESIVTLHRTIDAQLLILRDARDGYWAPGSGPEEWDTFQSSRAVLALADTILGGA